MTPKRIKSRAKPLLSPAQVEILGVLKAGGHIITDRVNPIACLRLRPIRRATMQRLERLGYVRQDHFRTEVNGSESWQYLITIEGLEALREA